MAGASRVRTPRHHQLERDPSCASDAETARLVREMRLGNRQERPNDQPPARKPGLSAGWDPVAQRPIPKPGPA